MASLRDNIGLSLADNAAPPDAPAKVAAAPDASYVKALQGYFDFNKPHAVLGVPYQTQLQPTQEQAFLTWLQQNSVPFNPTQQIQDYDMRGFWQALQNQDPRAMAAIDPNDKRMHYPDYWKTPYHETFSNESQWATEGAPKWNERDQLVMPDGTVVFDDRTQNQSDQMGGV